MLQRGINPTFDEVGDGDDGKQSQFPIESPNSTSHSTSAKATRVRRPSLHHL